MVSSQPATQKQNFDSCARKLKRKKKKKNAVTHSQETTILLILYEFYMKYCIQTTTK